MGPPPYEQRVYAMQKVEEKNKAKQPDKNFRLEIERNEQQRKEIHVVNKKQLLIALIHGYTAQNTPSLSHHNQYQKHNAKKMNR